LIYKKAGRLLYAAFFHWNCMFLDFITTNLLWTEGRHLIAVIIALGVIGIVWHRVLLYTALIFFLISFWFFRSPERVCPSVMHDDTIVCPADGKIVDIQFKKEILEGFAQRVSIFLSPFDVHVNWIPTTGIVKYVCYEPGKFTMAFLPKSSLENEHNDILIERADGQCIKVRQIAGTIARRIVCWVEQGDLVEVCQKFGMIRFGSRVDIFLPSTVQLAVGMGQKVYGGQTILGRWR
jgi:phosphatidylserine decarboxylase